MAQAKRCHICCQGQLEDRCVSHVDTEGLMPPINIETCLFHRRALPKYTVMYQQVEQKALLKWKREVDKMMGIKSMK